MYSTVVQSLGEIDYYFSSLNRFHFGGLPELSSCLGAKFRSGSMFMQNKVGLYILYVIVVVAIAYLVYVTQGFGIWKNSQLAGGAKKDAYQAVFLSNGQVYFGHLSDVNSQYAAMDDIYYLQVQKIQPKDEATTENQKLTLIKLGNEIHGPEDAMKINRDQILFWEDLKEDGKVVQAIKEYQSTGGASSTGSGSTSGSTVVPETTTTSSEE